MARIQDVYELDSKADTSGIDQGTQAVQKNSAAIARAGQTAARASGGLGRMIQRLGSALPRAANIARGAVRGLALSFGALLAGGIFAVINAIRGLPAFLSGMRESLEGTRDAAGGAGGNLAAAAEDAVGASESFAQAADTIDAAQKKITGEFGAFGKVGEGFIQRAGRVIEQATETAKNAGEAAKAAVDSLDDAVSGLGAAEGATTRFGKALDRLGAGWENIRKIFFDALAVGMTPLLEELAKVMEDPRFQEFVKLLGEDLAKILLQLTDWLAEDGIPGFLEFIETINEIGGPVDYIKRKVQELRDSISRELGFITRIANGLSFVILKLRDNWYDLVRSAINLVQALRDRIVRWFSEIAGSSTDNMNTVEDALRKPWRGLSDFISGIWNNIQRIFADNINVIIDTLNALIRAYNRIAGAIGVPTISEIGRIGTPAPTKPKPPEGAQSRLPSGAAAGMTVNINVGIAPGGFATPEEAGERVAQSYIRRMRAMGVRL